MTAAKPTPGPWFVRKPHPIEPDAPLTIFSADGTDVAVLAYINGNEHETAALIARAPSLEAENAQLREALERLHKSAEDHLQHLETSDPKGDPDETELVLQDETRNARAALRGEE